MVSVLLLVGAGLILLEGPVGPSYLRQLIAPKKGAQVDSKAVDNSTAPAAAKQAKATNLNSTTSTWANTLDDASPLHSTVLGEIPVSEKVDPSTASK